MKMKLRNKILLSMGTVAAVVAPVAAVISCGGASDTSSEYNRERALWATTQAFVTNKYQELLIAKITDNASTDASLTGSAINANYAAFGKITEAELDDYNKLFGYDETSHTFSNHLDLLAFLKSYVREGLYNDNSYLGTLSQKLIHVNVKNDANLPLYQNDDLIKDHFQDYTFTKTDVTSFTNVDNKNLVDHVFNPAVTINNANYFADIWNQNLNNFKTNFMQYLIAYYYLNTSKDNYESVFTKVTGATQTLSGLEPQIQVDNFVLGLKTYRAKYAFDWKVTLDDSYSKTYANVTKTPTEIDSLIKLGGAISDSATSTIRRSLIPTFYASESDAAKNSVWNMVAANKDIVGYQGISAKSALASTPSAIVDFKTYDQDYAGYIDPDKSTIVTDETQKLVQPGPVAKLSPASGKTDLEIVKTAQAFAKGTIVTTGPKLTVSDFDSDTNGVVVDSVVPPTDAGQPGQTLQYQVTLKYKNETDVKTVNVLFVGADKVLDYVSVAYNGLSLEGGAYNSLTAKDFTLTKPYNISISDPADADLTKPSSQPAQGGLVNYKLKVSYQGFTKEFTVPITYVAPIKLAASTTTGVAVEKVIMLMPTLENGTLTLKYLQDNGVSVKDPYMTLKRILLSQSASSLYTEAISYYASKDNKEFNLTGTGDDQIGGIRLGLVDEAYRSYVRSQFALPFIKTDDEMTTK